MYSYRDRPLAPARSPSGALAFLRRVYLLFTGGVWFAVVGALVALYAGTPVDVATRGGSVAHVPPVVGFALQHWFLMFIGYIAAFFAASFLRRVRGVNIVALFGYAFITGLFIAPSVFVAQAMASAGHTLDASPVRDAFLLTAAAFVGLSGYTLVSRRDFSNLGAALTIGLFVLIGASLLGFFVHAAVFQLAVASMGVLLFAGYILYDTSRIMRTNEDGDAVGAALQLFLDIVNMFLLLLRILSSARDR
ncbi:MAG TPA: Bax inhibitor-1/YccA family protein [Polyangiaceae bacterium]